MIVYIEFQKIWDFQILTIGNDVMMTSSLWFCESVYKTCQRQPTELKLGKLIDHSKFQKICKFENNDVITTSLPKQWKNADFRETKQIIYHSKGIDMSYPKMYFLLNLSHYVKSYGHLCQILAFFTMPTLQIWPCHVTLEANFEKILFFPNSALNIGKAAKFLIEKFSTSEVISQKPHGVFSTPPSF